MLLIITFTLFVIIVSAVLLFKRAANFKIKDPFVKSKKILLIIAHPDDESMFFGPTIMHLRKHGLKKLHILCLTSGYRKLELLEALKIYGIERNQIHLVHRPDLSDNWEKTWSKSTLETLINEIVTVNGIDTAVTFDKYGISGHPNHISIRDAISNFSLKIFELKTVNLLRKYSQIFDLVFSSVFDKREIRLLSNFHEYLLTVRAMTKHRSQLVWFRVCTMSEFRKEFMQLVNQFKNSGDESITSFYTAWTELKFFYIFAKQNIYKNMYEVMETILDNITEYLTDPESAVITKVCCVYSLFTIFEQQPVRKLVKIRLTLTDWQSLQNFVHNEIQNLQLETRKNMVAILKTLYEENAFRFVHARSFVAKPLSDIDDLNQDIEQASSMSMCVQSGTIAISKTINESYTEAKRHLKELIEDSITLDTTEEDSVTRTMEEINQTWHTLLKQNNDLF